MTQAITPKDHIVQVPEMVPGKSLKTHARQLASRTTFCGRPIDFCSSVYPWEYPPEVTCKICRKHTKQHD